MSLEGFEQLKLENQLHYYAQIMNHLKRKL